LAGHRLSGGSPRVGPTHRAPQPRTREPHPLQANTVRLHPSPACRPPQLGSVAWPPGTAPHAAPRVAGRRAPAIASSSVQAAGWSRPPPSLVPLPPAPLLLLAPSLGKAPTAGGSLRARPPTRPTLLKRGPPSRRPGRT